MRLPIDKAAQVLRLMVEGMSIRSTERLTQVHRDTIMRLMLTAGEKLQRMMRHKAIIGNPDKRHISTLYIERQNLTLRMMSRRSTRLTNTFSKKLSTLNAAITLHFAYYNFCRIHQSLKQTPCMAAGIADHVWTVEELVTA